MKAAILKKLGTKLAVEEMSDPVLAAGTTGDVIVDVVAAGVLPYAREVFSGERRYPLELPIVPGCGAIGRVRAVGGDATRLAVGDWVMCDPTVRSRDDALSPDIALQGWSARGEGGLQLARHYHHGSFAQQMRVPTECAVRLGAFHPANASRWCALNLLLVPYGGLLAAQLQAGETLLVSGATGNFGSAAVAVALAMGAGAVVVPGRNEAMLGELSRRFGARVHPVVLGGDEEQDRERMKRVAPAPIDCVLDLLPPSASTRPVRAAAMTVREGGRIVLMGGVGMLGGDDLGLPYPWIMRNNITVRGQWLAPASASPKIIALARSGQLDLDQFAIAEFDLDRVNEAVDYSADHSAPFHLTVVRP